MNKSYAFLNQIKSPGWLGLTNTTWDTDLLRILEDSSIRVDDYCHRFFECREETRYYDGATLTLMCPDDILSISELKVDMDGSQAWATTITSNQYVLYPLNSFPKMWLKSANWAAVNFANNIRQGVKVTGVFGYGTGYSATPYVVSGDTVQDNPLASNVTSMAITTPALFSPGMTLRLNSEQVYVSDIGIGTLTIVRGINGTTAASHIRTTPIYIYQYPGPIVESCLIEATRLWKRRETGFQDISGDTTTGITKVWKGIDPTVEQLLQRYIRQRI
jgi:hypothetical protein